MKKIALFLLLVLCLAQPALAGWNEGLAAYNRKDYATALREFRPLAKQGNPNAQYKLGLMYITGKGVSKDYSKAFYWLGKSDEHGNASAPYALGTMYANGQGVTVDLVQSLKWFTIADSRGNKTAAIIIRMLEKKLTPQQIAEARRLAREWKPKR